MQSYKNVNKVNVEGKRTGEIKYSGLSLNISWVLFVQNVLSPSLFYIKYNIHVLTLQFLM